jgi:hypothetical protein
MSSSSSSNNPNFSFHQDLIPMLLGFGGDTQTPPLKETVDLLNDITVEYISKITIEALQMRSYNNESNTTTTMNNKQQQFQYQPVLTPESILLTVANEPRKRDKIMDLLEANDSINKLRDVAFGINEPPPEEIQNKDREQQRKIRRMKKKERKEKKAAITITTTTTSSSKEKSKDKKDKKRDKSSSKDTSTLPPLNFTQDTTNNTMLDLSSLPFLTSGNVSGLDLFGSANDTIDLNAPYGLSLPPLSGNGAGGSIGGVDEQSTAMV